MTDVDLARLKIDRGGDRLASGGPRKPGVGRRVKFALAAILAALAALLAWRAAEQRPIQVETAAVGTVYPSQAYTLLNATGYVVARRKAAVASKGTGRLEWLGVEEGSRVRQNEVIARLENRDVQATRQQASANVQVAAANLQQAEAELRDAVQARERARDLAARNFIAKSQLDTAVAREDKARAAVASAKSAIAAAAAARRGADVAVEYTLIRAPFDGVVLTKHANIGDVITPFATASESKGAVVTMADMSTLEVEADVAESNLHKVALGQPCELQLDAFPEERFPCRVQRLVPTVDRAKATVLVKVRFDELDPRILPDMSAKVAFLSQPVPRGEKPVPAVNAAAVARRQGRNVVFVVDRDRARASAVDLGRKLGDALEVKTGVKVGDRVVLNPPEKLDDGDPVKTAAK